MSQRMRDTPQQKPIDSVTSVRTDDEKITLSRLLSEDVLGMSADHPRAYSPVFVQESLLSLPNFDMAKFRHHRRKWVRF